MTRPRLLPAGASRPKAPSAAQTDPSLSSFSLDAGGQAPTARYPDAFVTTGLRHVMTRQWSQALDFYRDEARRQPHEAAPELGQGAALLGLNRLEDAAHHFARGFELDPDFPLAQLVMDARPDDPVAWYELAAAMVAERTREAYLCAEIVLTECLGGADDDQLRGRAKRVQRDIARTLAQRERRDEGRFPPDGDRGPRRHAGLIAGAALLVLALIAGWLATRTPLPDEPTPPATNLPTPPAARAVPRRPPTPLPSSAPASRVVEAPSALPKH